MSDAAQAIASALSSAQSMLGKNEVPNRQEIMTYLQGGGENLDPHKAAWCAAFVSSALTRAGIPIPNDPVLPGSAYNAGAWAPNYQHWGTAIAPNDIQAGDILVANNGHHVGFAEGPIRQGANGPEAHLLAGNETDTSGQYAPGAGRAQVGMVGDRWVPLSQYSARRYEPDTTATTPTQPGTTINTSGVIDSLSRNIAGIESGGWKNPYQALGPQTSRGQAIGKYQVMPFNVGPWTQQALGQAMTPDQFRNSPDAQEAVFRDQMTRGLATMSPQDVASTWFTGKPYAVAGANASDINRTTNASYVARATAGIPNATAAPTAVASGAPPQPTYNPLSGGSANTGQPPAAQGGGVGGAIAALTQPGAPATPGGTPTPSPVEKLEKAVEGGDQGAGGGGGGGVPDTGLQQQQAAAAMGNMRQMQIYGQAQQMLAAMAQNRGGPLRWGAAPYGSGVGQTTPGTTLNSTGGLYV